MFLNVVLGDVLLKPIVLAGGTDISHWFNKKTREVSQNFKIRCILEFVLTCGIHPTALPARNAFFESATLSLKDALSKHSSTRNY